MSLMNAKVGDSVLIEGRDISRLSTVEQTTKLHVTCGGVKYRRSDGHPVHRDKWDFVWARIATQEDIVRCKDESCRRRYTARLRDVDFAKLSTNKLAQLVKTLESDE
jgi:hypothetical protein